jgi:hypothetical protein
MGAGPFQRGRAVMQKIVATLLFSLLFTNFCFADSEPVSVDGVWQDVRNENRYYSIHTKGGTVVLIDLSKLEQSSTTLKSSYVGKLDDGVLTQLAPEYSSNPNLLQVYLSFRSPTQAFVHPICEVCGVVLTELRKIF